MPNARRLLVASLAFVLTACSSGASSGSAGTSSGARRGQGATLAAVRARGAVKCGITQGAGFATPDDSGRWRGFDVDFCRALAVALFHDPNKLQLIPYTQQQRFSGLQSGEVAAGKLRDKRAGTNAGEALAGGSLGNRPADVVHLLVLPRPARILCPG